MHFSSSCFMTNSHIARWFCCVWRGQPLCKVPASLHGAAKCSLPISIDFSLTEGSFHSSHGRWHGDSAHGHSVSKMNWTLLIAHGTKATCAVKGQVTDSRRTNLVCGSTFQSIMGPKYFEADTCRTRGLAFQQTRNF